MGHGLWSQNEFFNPGLLGNQTSSKAILLPIEKQWGPKIKRSAECALFQPFYSRAKSQVAGPSEKIINVKYSDMLGGSRGSLTGVKNYYREKISRYTIFTGRINRVFTLLRGLTHCAKICNHPKLCQENDYEGDSQAKLEDVTYMLQSYISEKAQSFGV